MNDTLANIFINKAAQSKKIIEIESGSYLGEDDIVRFDDIYGRVDK